MIKCKDCENYQMRFYKRGHRESFDGFECRLSGQRVNGNAVDPDCIKNKKAKKKDITPESEWVEID